MKGVSLVPPAAEPIVHIELTVKELRGLLDAVLGKGLMFGAWDKLREAKKLIEAAGVEV